MAYAFSESAAAPHRLSLEGRGKLSVTGVQDIESFDEQSVVLVTTQGLLIVSGSGLHLQSLSLEGGGVSIDGTVDSLVYEQSRPAGGLLRRLLR